MQGIFKNNWKWFVSSLCLGLLREKGTTVQKFFPDVLKSVYSLQLKGEQHLEMKMKKTRQGWFGSLN